MPENNQMYGGYPDPSMPQGGQPYGYPDPSMPQGGQQPYGYPDPSMPQPQPYGYPDPSMPQPQPGMPPYGTPPKKKGLGVGAIIAIVAGVVVVAVVVGFLVLGNKGNSGNNGNNGNSGQTSGQTSGSSSSQTSSSQTSGSQTSSAEPTQQTGGQSQQATQDPASGSQGQQSTSDPAPAPAPAPAASAAPASNDWLSGEFTLDGQSFTLLRSGYRDIEASGWVLDERTQATLDKQYGGSYVLNPGEGIISSLDLVKGNEGGASVTVANLDSAVKDVRDCTLRSITVSTPLSYSKQSAPAFVVAGGGTLGMTIDQVTAIYGQPKPDNIYQSDGFAIYTYDVENDYMKQLRFQFSDGVVDEIEYQLG